MNYTIKVLKSQIEKHNKKLAELEKIKEDPEMYATIAFADDEIKDHNLCVSQLIKDINILLSNNK